MRAKVLVMAGGTGGHVFPGLAVAQALLKRNCSVEWLGTEKGIEYQLVPGAGIQLNTIDITGLRGKGLMAWINMPFLLLRAVTQALKILSACQPAVVLGMGGFASGPGALAARLRGIPVVIHEQNAIAGTTNKWLSKLTRHRLCAFPNALPKAKTVGNPVRESICQLPGPDKKEPLVGRKAKLLVLGGSLGARKLNQLMPAALAQLPPAIQPEVWHQTGEKTHDEALAAYTRHSLSNARIEPFIDDMASAYGWADLVICRAGALTVSEITAAGVAALLVPYPHAIDDHQTRNAQWLAENEAGLLCGEADLDVTTLTNKLELLLSNPKQLMQMAANAHALAKPDATARVVDTCLEVANG